MELTREELVVILEANLKNARKKDWWIVPLNQPTVEEIIRQLKEAPKVTAREAPGKGQIVFVEGGIAQYRGGVFYTGMEDPRWKYPIEWEVSWWLPIHRGHWK